MNLNELAGWYQNTISTYDKNKREESSEVKTIDGLGKYHLKPTKRKAELIDVDFVRGSEFSKAKRKQTLFTVIRLALLRLLLLPVYSKWWVMQTSTNIYKFLLTLYVLQVFNLGMYTYITTYGEGEHIVSMRDIVIPNLLSLLLSFIHSQITATASTDTNVRPEHSSPAKKGKQRQRLHKKKSNSVNDKTSTISPDKLVVDHEHLLNSSFNIQRSTNCPKGLRQRNANWNHVFSPYWVNRKTNQPKIVEPEEKSNCEDPITESERSTLDHGFESFNAKSSSSEEMAASPTIQNSFQSHLNGTSLRVDNQMADQYSNFKENLMSNGHDDDGKAGNFLSPSMNPHRQSNNVLISPWLGVTSNSECSYSSGSESDSMLEESETEHQSHFRSTLKPGSTTTIDKISCTLWCGNKTTKQEMSALDITSVISRKVETMARSCDYIYIGILFSILLASVPVVCRVCEAALQSTTNEFNIEGISTILLETAFISRATIIKVALGETTSERILLSIGLLLRFCLIFVLFFMLAVAERTFKQRLLYAKLFSHLTSSRRAQKSEVPHFRLSKLQNIKTWLSVRSYLKKRGPQRSVDVIVSAALVLSVVFVSFLCAESLNDSVQQHWQYDLEVFIWSCAVGCFILRFMTLGSAINAKYRSVSILITEQINLYLKMEQNPEKKQKFSAANSVLKLASDLLKEIEAPFKLSGFNINPYLSAAVRVLVVSALSGVCSEMLGFKLKLFKLKE